MLDSLRLALKIWADETLDLTNKPPNIQTHTCLACSS